MERYFSTVLILTRIRNRAKVAIGSIATFKFESYYTELLKVFSKKCNAFH